MPTVHLDIVDLDIATRKKSIVGYCAGMVLYTLVIVALYPQFEHSTSLNNITRNAPTLSALFGAVGLLTSPAGWLVANLYANFLPLVMLLMTIGYGASAIAGRDEDGTLALIVTVPITRRRVILEKAVALAIQGAGLAVATAITVVVGRWFHLDLPVGNVAGETAGTLLLGLDFGFMAMAVGAATGRRGTAIGVTSAVAAASYLVSSLAPVVPWVRPVRFLSPFFWSVGNGQLAGGIGPMDVAVLSGVAVVALAVAVAGFARLDLH